MKLKIKILSGVLFFCFIAVSCKKENSSYGTKLKDTENSSPNKVLSFSTITEVEYFKKELEMITKAYEKIGYKIKVHPFPSKRALQEAQNNKLLDGELGRVKEAEKIFKDLIRIKVPFGQLKIFPYYFDKSINIKSWNDLSKYNFGYTRGSIIIEQNLKSGTGKTHTTFKQCFDLLKEGRLDIVISEEGIENAPWFKALQPNIIKSEQPISTYKVYHYINKKHTSIVNDLTKALSEVTGNPVETD